MIFHSVVPYQEVFKDNAYKFDLLEIDYLGEKIEVSPLENNQYRVNRIISTLPNTYLNPKLMPGTIITGIF